MWKWQILSLNFYIRRPQGGNLFQQTSFSGRSEMLPHVSLQGLYVETEQSEWVKFSTVTLKFYRWNKKCLQWMTYEFKDILIGLSKGGLPKKISCFFWHFNRFQAKYLRWTIWKKNLLPQVHRISFFFHISRKVSLRKAFCWLRTIF